MKPAIYYAVIRRGWTTTLGFFVAAVTSEKHRRVYFRKADTDEPSMCSERDVRAKYPTREAADAAIVRISDANAANMEEVNAARKALRQAEQRREQMLDDALELGKIK